MYLLRSTFVLCLRLICYESTLFVDLASPFQINLSKRRDSRIRFFSGRTVKRWPDHPCTQNPPRPTTGFFFQPFTDIPQNLARGDFDVHVRRTVGDAIYNQWLGYGHLPVHEPTTVRGGKRNEMYDQARRLLLEISKLGIVLCLGYLTWFRLVLALDYVRPILRVF